MEIIMNQETNNTLEACKQNQSASEIKQQDNSSNEPQTSTIFDWTKDFILSEDEANSIASPEWIIPNLIISGHIILIPAEPNGGKTTIMFYLAGVMAEQGYEVFYVNVDISGGDAKPLVDIAKNLNFGLMLPDMKTGLSIDHVIHKLVELSKSNKRFDDTVFIFDTVKKMVNVMSKDAAKRFFQLMRTLSAKGMTVILLGHTNKHPDNEGKPIYEGTGDMRADVDELIYLVPQRNDDKSMIVTTVPDKQRGSFKPISFNIAADRTVTILGDAIDTIAANKEANVVIKDEPIINAIRAAIDAGNTSQQVIVDYCSQHHKLGERSVKSILCKYAQECDGSSKGELTTNHLWKKERGERKSYSFSVLSPN
jgi:hypothetical protein